MSLKLRSLFHSEKTVKLVRQLMILLAVLLLSNLAAVNFFESKYLLLIDVGVIVFWLSYHFMMPMFFAVVFLHPFVGFEFALGDFNAPYGDILVTILFFAWLYRKALLWPKEKFDFKTQWPGLAFFLLFVVSAILSMIFNEATFHSVKYLLRPIMFFYLCFVMLPLDLIRTKIQLKKVLQIFFIVGVISAVVGLISLFITPSVQWYESRSTPINFFGINFWGGNHNAIAEIMTVAIPFTLILLGLSKKIREQGIYIVGLILMSQVLLLTFSRSGWLALILEMLILFVFGYGAKVPRLKVLPLFLVFLMLPMILFFSGGGNTGVVAESTSNRAYVTQLSFYIFQQAPIFGHGLDTFRSLIDQNYVYTIDFGAALDSHGFIQKIIVEQGIFGLLCWFALLTYLFGVFLKSYLREKDRSERFYLVAILMMFCGAVFFQLFSTSYYLAKMWLPIGVGLAAVSLYRQDG
jgi:O-antigen ligase